MHFGGSTNTYRKSGFGLHQLRNCFSGRRVHKWTPRGESEQRGSRTTPSILRKVVLFERVANRPRLALQLLLPALRPTMYTLLQDLRFALRQMRRSPGFAITAVFILALGIAANVIVFGVLQALILEPLDVPRPDRVVTFATQEQGYPIYSYPEVRDVREGNTVFSSVAADMFDLFGLETNGVTRPAWGDEVSGQYFEVMGIKPFLGRLLRRADDDHPGAAEVAVITWPAWKNTFGADPNIVGKIVRINKHPYTIVGVTPEGFYGTEKFMQLDVFVPMANEASLDGVNWLESRSEKGAVFAIARIKDGITKAQVQAELNTIAARITRQNPKDEDTLAFKLARPGMIGDFVGGAVRRFLGGMMVLAGIVLLAACANLGGLFAARTADRTREIAIRMAIGSSRWRILRQVLMEAFVISILGGACASVLAWVTLAGLARWHPPTDYPMKFLVYPQPSLILMAFLISVLACVLFGLMPLRQIFHADPNDAIKGAGSQSSAGRRWALRDVLLAAQIALCCVTITAAFVSMRGMVKSLTVDKGFNPSNATLTRFDLSEAGYSGEAAEQMQRQLLEKVSQLPGVEAAAYANTTPLADANDIPVFAQQTTDFRDSHKAFDTYLFDVSPGYFAAAQTPLLTGRDISFADKANTPPVAIVNQQFARRLFHSDQAVGRYFKDRSGKSIQIVGMVPDGKYFLLSEPPQETVFFPILQRPTPTTSLIVRTRPDSSGVATADMAATVRKLIRDLDPGIPIRLSSDWTSTLAFSLFPAQVATVSLGLFGAFGLLLSITGTFGLASYTVSKRLRELSIRVALGAQARQILSAALGRMLILLATGSVAGILLGVAASKILSAIVFQATAQDPFVLAAVAFTILLTGTLSVAGPVRRALHVDPALLLREQ
jgi:predicted permease